MNTTTKREPSKILFLSNQNQGDGRIAEILFESEARKSEVFWTASSRVIALREDSDDLISSPPFVELKSLGFENPDLSLNPIDAVTLDDLQQSDLTVLIQSAGEDNFLKQKFPSFSGDVEVWNISAQSQIVDTLLQNVKSLMVRLILKGGKRPAIPIQEQTAADSVPKSSSKSAIRVSLESKGRRGKKVTVISGLPTNQTYLEKLATELKQTCGTGGTVKDGRIEIQGDQCQRILTELQRRGLQAKRSGG